MENENKNLADAIMGDAGEDLKTEETTEEETTEEVEETEEEDSSETGQSEETEETDEDKITRLEKENENHRQGMLSAKAKLKGKQLSKLESKEDDSKTDDVDVSEKKILDVVHRQNEKVVLKDVLNSKSTNYIKELADDNDYKEIINYLPRNYDKSSKEGITKALRVAVNSWKFDNNIPMEKESNKQVQSDLSSVGSTNVKTNKAPKKVKGGNIIKKDVSPSEWY